MSKQTELVGLARTTTLDEVNAAYSAGALSNRNLIINGAMQVAQRGNRAATGFTGSFYAGPDRWLVNRSGTGSTGFSQISSTGYGGTKAAQATFLAAGGETFIVTQRIEAANIAHLAGQSVTLSFWVSGSNDAGSATLNASLSYAGSSDNFTSETVIGSPQSIAYTGTAQRITMTVTLPSGAANGVAVRIAGAKTDETGWFTLTFGGVQLEVGSVATPFEHRSYGQELALCQRYYSVIGGGSYVGIDVGQQFSTTGSIHGVQYPAPMRAAPSISFDNLIATDRTVFDETVTGFSVVTAGDKSAYIRTVWSTARGSVGDAVLLAIRNGYAGGITFDAEL